LKGANYDRYILEFVRDFNAIKYLGFGVDIGGVGFELSESGKNCDHNFGLLSTMVRVGLRALIGTKYSTDAWFSGDISRFSNYRNGDACSFGGAAGT
jgi:hypothetical protein